MQCSTFCCISLRIARVYRHHKIVPQALKGKCYYRWFGIIWQEIVESSQQKYCFTKMKRKSKKQEQEAKAWKKVARNHEIPWMLKAGVSANQIAKDFGLSYTGAKKICARLK